MLEPFKYLVQCVAVERDETGRIVGERPAETQTAYLPAELVALAEKFERELGRLNGEAEADE